MSANPYVPDAASRAHEKAASKEEVRKARQEFMAGWNEMAADFEAKLAAAGITVDDEPEPDMTGIQIVDYSRRVEMPAGIPVNISAVQAISSVYASEAALINATTRAVQEYHKLFCQDPEDQLFASAQEQALLTKAYVDHQREITDDVLRKGHALYHAGPPETHRVLQNHEHEELLQDWAKKRGPPNLLEVEILSQYMGLDVYVLYDWFKARGLQKQCIDLMMGEALSHNKKWRKIGLLRYRAAKVQTNWSLRLAWLRKQHKKSKAEKGRNEEVKERSGKTDDETAVGTGGDQGSKMSGDESEVDSDEYDSDEYESDPDVTMADVRGEMDPFISQEMD